MTYFGIGKLHAMTYESLLNGNSYANKISIKERYKMDKMGGDRPECLETKVDSNVSFTVSTKVIGC